MTPFNHNGHIQNNRKLRLALSVRENSHSLPAARPIRRVTRDSNELKSPLSDSQRSRTKQLPIALNTANRLKRLPEQTNTLRAAKPNSKRVRSARLRPRLR